MSPAVARGRAWLSHSCRTCGCSSHLTCMAMPRPPQRVEVNADAVVKVRQRALEARDGVCFGMHTRQSSARFRDSGPVHSTAAHQCCTECQSWLGSRASEADLAFQLPERHSSLLTLIQSEHSIDSSRFVDFRRAAILLDAYLLRALQLVTSSSEVKVGAGRAD